MANIRAKKGKTYIHVEVTKSNHRKLLKVKYKDGVTITDIINSLVANNL